MAEQKLSPELSKGGISSRDLFAQIEGSYGDYASFSGAVIDAFCANASNIPIGYRYTDLIQMGQNKRWVSIDPEGGPIVVKVLPKSHEIAMELEERRKDLKKAESIATRLRGEVADLEKRLATQLALEEPGNY